MTGLVIASVLQAVVILWLIGEVSKLKKTFGVMVGSLVSGKVKVTVLKTEEEDDEGNEY